MAVEQNEQLNLPLDYLDLVLVQIPKYLDGHFLSAGGVDAVHQYAVRNLPHGLLLVVGEGLEEILVCELELDLLLVLQLFARGLVVARRHLSLLDLLLLLLGELAAVALVLAGEEVAAAADLSALASLDHLHDSARELGAGQELGQLLFGRVDEIQLILLVELHEHGHADRRQNRV